ncbi:hypothetical protein B296_00022941 [Ensete ventricosum]|uniref:Plant heme peroxidase family profile domain-containing protein n=1 Tax=Ensete ventricosum TaxID=4639 RepID=A0A426Z2T5_ENSVE|nr:hypothetical protein B296_00022941 [Ensete ventricosum]
MGKSSVAKAARLGATGCRWALKRREGRSGYSAIGEKVEEAAVEATRSSGGWQRRLTMGGSASGDKAVAMAVATARAEDNMQRRAPALHHHPPPTRSKKMAAALGAATVLALALLCLTVVPSHAALQVGFYRGKCNGTDVEATIKSIVAARFGRDRSIVPALLRLQFHDCFVRVRAE